MSFAVIIQTGVATEAPEKNMFDPVQKLLAVFLIGLSPLYAETDCGALDIGEIVAAAAIEPPDSVRFREERHSPMFREALVLTGMLDYLEPGVLRKRVESPFQESYLVEPDQVTVTRGDEVQVLRARQGRLIGAILGGIEALLAGDMASIEENFEYCAEGSADSWTLALTPSSSRLQNYLKGLRVSGAGDSIETIRIELDDEEWHFMEILPADPAAEE